MVAKGKGLVCPMGKATVRRQDKRVETLPLYHEASIPAIKKTRGDLWPPFVINPAYCLSVNLICPLPQPLPRFAGEGRKSVLASFSAAEPPKNWLKHLNPPFPVGRGVGGMGYKIILRIDT
jgi:hypothetical protein